RKISPYVFTCTRFSVLSWSSVVMRYLSQCIDLSTLIWAGVVNQIHRERSGESLCHFSASDRGATLEGSSSYPEIGLTPDQLGNSPPPQISRRSAFGRSIESRSGGDNESITSVRYAATCSAGLFPDAPCLLDNKSSDIIGAERPPGERNDFPL